MGWTVETVSAVDAEIEALPVKLRARLVRLLESVENVGLEALQAPHAKHLDGKLGAASQRRRGNREGGLRDGSGTAGCGPACVREEVEKDTVASARDREGTNETGNAMTRLTDLKKRLLEDPEFRKEYARVDEEFELIEALVRARTAAKLTQAELAKRLGTTQSAVARLEGGRVSPSFATLRRYAEATGTRLTVGLVPADS